MSIDPLGLLHNVLTSRSDGAAAYRFEDVLGAMYGVIAAPLDWRAEQLLLQIVRVRDELPFAADSEFPHSLSPEDLLKSLAIQALVRWTGLTHLREIRLAEEATSSLGLRSIIRGIVLRAQSTVRPRDVADEIGMEVVETDAESEETRVLWFDSRYAPAQLADSAIGRRDLVRHATITTPTGLTKNAVPRVRRRTRHTLYAGLGEEVVA